LLIWASDRFIVGTFCFPWECVHRNADLEALLLNNNDLPTGWTSEHTYDYAYVPRASSSYIERTFLDMSDLGYQSLYETIYQYRSVRGASFQFNKLIKELPTSYSIHSTLISPQLNLQVGYASAHVYNCVYDNKRATMCYYLARYEEYVLLIEMPFSGNQIADDIFSEMVRLADGKFSKIVNK
jgi:hypothetical protein